METIEFKKDPLRFFHPILPERELKNRPVGVQVGSTKIVLFRDHEGHIGALEDRCPHRFTPLSLGQVLPNGRLACQYHGWNFDRNGDCRNPSLKSESMRCPVRTFKVVKRHHFLWVANPDVPESQFPEFMEDGFELLAAYNIEFRAPLLLVFDNFSENEHFPYVHQYFGWDSQGSKQAQFECSKTDKTVEASYYGPQRTFPGASLFGVRKNSWMRNGWLTKFQPVHSTYTSWICSSNNLTTPMGGYINRLTTFMTPIDETKTLMSIFQSVQYTKPVGRLKKYIYKKLFVSNVRHDIFNDVEFVEKLSHVPTRLDKAVLGRFDRPLVYNRELFEKIYLGHEGSETEAPWRNRNQKDLVF